MASNWGNREREVAESYAETLESLTFNSRPVIMTLTELANDYSRENFGHVIVHLIEARIRNTTDEAVKLPTLYLMDSIVKNHGDAYKSLFATNLVSTFSHVFSRSNEKTRAALFKLRNTWTPIFPSAKLYQLDKKVKTIDPAWPITAQPRSNQQPNIHINPAVFNRQPSVDAVSEDVRRMERELMEIKKKKLEMEILQAKKEMMVQSQKLVEEGSSKSLTTKPSTSSSSVLQTPSSTTVAASSAPSSSAKKVVVDKSKARDPRMKDKMNREIADLLSKTEKKARSRSPQRESPTSTSSPKESQASKEATPPPPPKIRGDFKANKTVLKSMTSSHSKDRREKRSKDKARKDRDRKSWESTKTQESLNGDEAPTSSPSPPPPVKEKESKKKTTFRIPKRKGSRQIRNPNRSPSPTTSEQPRKRSSPQASSKKDQPVDKKAKLNLELFGHDSPPHHQQMPSPSSQGWAKFKEVNPDEYRTPLQQQQRADHASGGGGGSARGRNHRPQDYQGRRPGGPEWGPNHRHPPGPPQFRDRPGGPPLNPFMGGFGGPPAPPHQQVANNPLLHQQQQMMHAIMQQAHETDPDVVINQVIPVIIHEGQESLRSRRMNPEQFSELMRQVSLLREQALMAQADKRHHVQMSVLESNKENGTTGLGPMPEPWVGQQPPGFRPQPAFHPPGPMGPMGPRPPMGGPPDMMGAQQEPFGGANRDLPMANSEDLEVIANDPVNSIEIDNVLRTIRFYGEQGTVVLDNQQGKGGNELYDLNFKPQDEAGSSTRRIIIDDSVTVSVPLCSQDYTEFLVDGATHRVKIGAPTRELWIDGQWYSCFFDNTIQARFGMKVHSVYLEGPAPTVDIGKQLRKDLCAGTVQLVVNGDISAPMTIFLDAKPQRVDINGKAHVLRFVESLRTLLINGHPFKTEFGGYPMVVYVNQVRQYLRLTSLPQNVRPGHVRIWRMDRDQANKMEPLSPPQTATNENSMDGMEASNKEVASLDRLLSILPSPQPERTRKDSTSQQYAHTTPGRSEPGSEPTKNESPGETPVDLQKLWEGLLGAGLVGHNEGIPGLENTEANKKEAKEEKKKGGAAKDKKAVPAVAKVKEEANKVPTVKKVVLKSHDQSIKQRQDGIVNMLYDPSALQCKNCGLRYAPCEMIAYSQHLDWHFRMKRREKDNAKRAQSRKWFFERMDWIVSDEIEDNDKDDAENGDGKNGDNLEDSIPTVPAGSNPGDNICPVCNEEFDQFYKEDLSTLSDNLTGSKDSQDDAGQWHLRNAIRPDGPDGQAYHPQCHTDVSLIETGDVSMNDESVEQEEKSEPMQVDQQVKQEPADGASEMQTTDDDKKETDTVVKSEPMDEAEQPSEAPKDTDANPTDADPKADPKADDADSDKIKQEPIETADQDQDTADVAADDETPSSETEVKNEPESSDVNTSLDDLTPLTADAQVMAPPSFPTAANIKINISAQSTPTSDTVKTETASSSSADTTTSASDATVKVEEPSPPVEESEFDPDAIIQERSNEDEEDPFKNKPKLKGRKLVVMPPQNKGEELSGLCSIM